MGRRRLLELIAAGRAETRVRFSLRRLGRGQVKSKLRSWSAAFISERAVRRRPRSHPQLNMRLIPGQCQACNFPSTALWLKILTAASLSRSRYIAHAYTRLCRSRSCVLSPLSLLFIGRLTSVKRACLMLPRFVFSLSPCTSSVCMSIECHIEQKTVNIWLNLPGLRRG